MKLLVVESPTKARKLWGILNNIKGFGKWQVVASVGHLIDLPDDDIAVFPEDNFTALFQVNPDKKDRLHEIFKEAEKAEAVYLGADPDREGEGIAWHIWNVLRKRFPDKPIHRITYNAITKSEIKKAVEAPSVVDMNLVEAQIARRVLDRLVGYTFTPFLQFTVKGFLPVGRVQAVALQKIVEREQERRFHIPVAMYHIELMLRDVDGNTKKMSTEKTPDEEAVKTLYSKLRKKQYLISVNTERKEIGPPPPFVTSSLLQELCSKLGVQSDQIMKACQTLFQNGHITYHRTDSTRISPQRASITRKFVSEKYGGLESPKIRMYGKGGAHEAIMVTHPELTPKDMGGAKTLKGVYEAIWQRSLATQMKPVVVDRTTFKVLIDREAIVSDYGDKIIAHGWDKVLPRRDRPVFEPTDIKRGDIRETQSEPNRRYNDASVIKLLKDCGVGRPSTYANILSTLRRHKYISGRGALFATLRGELLIHFLTRWIPDLVNSEFTAGMEEGLDLISSGKDSVACALSELRKYWGWISEKVGTEHGELRPYMVCPKCDSGYRMALTFPFFGQPYFQCRKCKQYTGVDFDPKTREIVPFVERSFYGVCKKCGKESLQLLQSKYGFWVVCKDCKTKNFH